MLWKHWKTSSSNIEHLESLGKECTQGALQSPQNSPEGFLPIVARVERAQEESNSLLGLRSQRVSLGMPKEMRFEEQNIEGKGTSEGVPKTLHSNFPWMAGQLLSCECARESWRNAVNNRQEAQEWRWISATRKHQGVKTLLLKMEGTSGLRPTPKGRTKIGITKLKNKFWLDQSHSL